MRETREGDERARKETRERERRGKRKRREREAREKRKRAEREDREEETGDRGRVRGGREFKILWGTRGPLSIVS